MKNYQNTLNIHRSELKRKKSANSLDFLNQICYNMDVNM